jgi:hypothetical protein
MDEIETDGNFSIAELIAYLADKGAKQGDLERITVLTEKQRITLYVGVAAIEDATPKPGTVK